MQRINHVHYADDSCVITQTVRKTSMDLCKHYTIVMIC